MSFNGSCLCGALRYTVDQPLGPVTACHCTQCRKISGHYVAAAPANWENVTVEGELKWFESSPQARRGFCPNCGSYLFWEEYDGKVYIMAGTLDGDTGLTMDGHIFYADKGDYYRAGQTLPCWAQDRGDKEIEP